MVLSPLLFLLLFLAGTPPRGAAELTDGNNEHLKREHSLIKPYQGAWGGQGLPPCVTRLLSPLPRSRLSPLVADLSCVKGSPMWIQGLGLVLPLHEGGENPKGYGDSAARSHTSSQGYLARKTSQLFLALSRLIHQ